MPNDAFPHPVIIDTLTSTQRSKANRAARRQMALAKYNFENEQFKSGQSEYKPRWPFQGKPPIPMVTIWYEQGWGTLPAIVYATNPRYSRHFRRSGGRI